MSLGYEVLRYVDRCFRNPTDAGDPRLLKRLESYAKEAFEGIVALHAPASPMTWEVNTIMVGSVQTSRLVKPATRRAGQRRPRRRRDIRSSPGP